jgi:lipopolysaccharide export LptBFGC system permease protein LptF
MRAPLTIWRFLALDLGRLILLTTTIFVCVLSFAATVKYFAEGSLTLTDMLIFMLYAIPPMLQYALPFAALFGATLAYHRFEQDNERVAAHAGGVSHRALLLPGLVAGLALFGVMWAINQEIAPRYLRKMEELVFTRVGKVLVSTIESGEPIVFNNWMVHADDIDRLSSAQTDDGRAAQERFALTGVCALQLDDEGRVKLETTAGVAWVYVYPGGGFDAGADPRTSGDASTVVWMRLEDASTYRPGEEQRASGESLTQVLRVPNTFRDNPKYLTYSELAGARRNPDSLNVIDSRRRNLAFHEAQRRITDRIDRALRDDGQIELTYDEGRPLTLRARGIRWHGPGWEVLPLDDGVVVDWELPGERLVRTTAESALLFVDIGEDVRVRRLDVTLQLEQPATTNLDADGNPIGQPGRRQQRRLTDLSLTSDPLRPLLAMSSAELMEEVAETRLVGPSPDEYVAGAYNDLRRRIQELLREITSKQHERVAMAMFCLVTVLTGSTIALRVGRGQPLTAYLWSFFPAIASLVTISVGQQVGDSAGLLGYILLWAGVVGLAAYGLVAFVGLVRH